MKSKTAFFRWLVATIVLTMTFDTALTRSLAQAEPMTETADKLIFSSQEGEISAASNSSPLMFIENVGQFEPKVKYQVRGTNATVFLTDNDIWFTLVVADPNQIFEDPVGTLVSMDESFPQYQRTPKKGVNLRFTFPGANSKALIEPLNKLETRVSYFTGNGNASRFADVPVWEGIRYVDIYPGADYFFFRARCDSSGLHNFSVTLEEHIENECP